ncbi:ABC transporter ATP-binding protein [Branchiibius sp. NY16-3462-2]|uniref:ABC transporter ATP-binding protein n=1 Tax=Branchiibius sp. NY16-3462-2 TaxID=1807500 RepID=UPI00079A6FFD|nr:ABC transporter ATP-binding protein [Branchiibius sp. NY16-3462-2]KYH46282.1 ABC transporter ATP-binding protein [Branchiibius sp. NY16-3462-2]
MSQASLELRSITLTIGGAHILRGVDLDVAGGELIGVIGPNGAGKTTLFNVISGLVRPTGGQVVFDGRDVTRDRVAQRARAGLGRTFQTSSLFPGLSVRENVRLAAQERLGRALSLVRFPRSGDEATTIADDCLTQVGLGHRGDGRAGELSHGDKRKLEIAVLLAADPSMVLLDEPMAGVASADVPGLVEVIGGLHAGGRTVLMVEHHMDVVLGLADRVAVMHRGQLLACDTPAAVMADPEVQSAYLGDVA